jgi:C4-dicarboxylate-specific signal transduction histidine kinase
MVLLNLVLNAEQALADHADGHVTLTARSKDGVVRVVLADNGPGVPEHERERVFEAFFTTGRPGATLGLGLCVSRQLAVEHGGHLRLADGDCAPGARWELELPAVM